MVEDKKHGFSDWSEFYKAEKSVKTWGYWMLATRITVAVILWIVALIVHWKFALLVLLLVVAYYSFLGLRVMWRKDREMRDLKRRVKEYQKERGYA